MLPCIINYNTNLLGSGAKLLTLTSTIRINQKIPQVYQDPEAVSCLGQTVNKQKLYGEILEKRAHRYVNKFSTHTDGWPGTTGIHRGNLRESTQKLKPRRIWETDKFLNIFLKLQAHWFSEVNILRDGSVWVQTLTKSLADCKLCRNKSYLY